MPPSQTSACHVRFDDHLLSPMASSISFPEYPTHKPLKSALRRSSVQLSTSPRMSAFPSNDSRISLSSSLDSSKAPKSNSSRKTVKVKKPVHHSFYIMWLPGVFPKARNFWRSVTFFSDKVEEQEKGFPSILSKPDIDRSIEWPARCNSRPSFKHEVQPRWVLSCNR